MLRTALTLMAAAAVAATPLTWSQTTRFAEMKLTLPAMIAHAPVLHDRIYRDERKAMAAFAREAQEEEAGDDPPVRHRRHADYLAGVETPRLLSLSGLSAFNREGDRSFTTILGVVFDKASNVGLDPIDLVRPGTDLRALDKAVCDAARAAKQERAKGDWVEKEDSNFHCPTWRGVIGDDGKLVKDAGPVQFTLAKGDLPDKAAGLIFFYSEYQIGSYADGPYEAIVPLAAFQKALKPVYASEFGGGHPKGAKPFV